MNYQGFLTELHNKVIDYLRQNNILNAEIKSNMDNYLMTKYDRVKVDLEESDFSFEELLLKFYDSEINIFSNLNIAEISSIIVPDLAYDRLQELNLIALSAAIQMLQNKIPISEDTAYSIFEETEKLFSEVKPFHAKYARVLYNEIEMNLAFATGESQAISIGLGKDTAECFNRK